MKIIRVKILKEYLVTEAAKTTPIMEIGGMTNNASAQVNKKMTILKHTHMLKKEKHMSSISEKRELNLSIKN